MNTVLFKLMFCISPNYFLLLLERGEYCNRVEYRFWDFTGWNTIEIFAVLQAICSSKWLHAVDSFKYLKSLVPVIHIEALLVSSENILKDC